MTTLSVVIPAYNEEAGIADIVNRVLAVETSLRSAGVDHLELLVVDDGSRDRTGEIVNSIPGARLIRHPINRGYGAALKTGFCQARGELIGFLDADSTYPPEYFPQLCQAALSGDQLVIGSRMAGADSKMPLVRRIGNLLFANLLSIVGGQKVTDSASGMRVFQRGVLEQLYPLPDGLNLTPVMSTRALHEGIRVKEIPIPYSERSGRSKLNALRDGKVFLSSILWTALSYNPVRILGMAGAGGVLVAVVVLAGLVFARLQGVKTLENWQVASLYAGMVSLVAGISLFSLGTTFNYLVSLFYKRPVRQGLFGKPVFKTPIDRHFGWIGLVTFGAGLVIGVVSVVLGLNGWELNRLWLYLLGSAMLVLTGVQLVISWIVMRVLEDLSQRESLSQIDLQVPAQEFQVLAN